MYEIISTDLKQLNELLPIEMIGLLLYVNAVKEKTHLMYTL